jgi:putative hemolysin
VDDNPLISLFYLFCLLILSAFFSGSETALFSLPSLRIQHLRAEQGRRGQLLAALMGEAHRLLITLLIGNTIVNVAASAAATFLIVTTFQRLHLPESGGIALAIGGMTFLLLIFGEVVPKIYAVHRAERFSLRVVGLLTVAVKLASPFVAVFSALATLVSRTVGRTDREQVTEGELRMMARLGEEYGVLDEDEADVVQAIFDFGGKVVREVMTPRIDMCCVSDETTADQLLEYAREVNHSRIPTYRGTTDHITGVAYVKDILIQSAAGAAPVSRVAREAYVVPETKPIHELLREFQRLAVHIAIVTDEYGGTAGLVTLEDLLEEIVGEIIDEHDIVTERYRWIDSNTILVDARLSIDDLEDLTGRTFPEAEYDTVGGLVLVLAGRVPAAGDTFRFQDLTLRVEGVGDRRRITVVRISFIPEVS